MKDKLHFCGLVIISLGLVACLVLFGKHYLILESVLMLVTCVYLIRTYRNLYKARNRMELLICRYWFYRIPSVYIVICIFLLLWNRINMLSASTNLAFLPSIIFLSKLMETLLKRKIRLK